MIDSARRLLKALETKGLCRTSEIAMSQGEIRQAVRALDSIVDDDNHPVPVVHTWLHEDDIIALELTQTGHSLASAI